MLYDLYNFYVLKYIIMPKNDSQEKGPNMSDEWRNIDLEQLKTKSELDEALWKEKVYGEYPGRLNPDFIKEFCGDSNDIRSEIAIFYEYYNVTLWRYNFMRVLPWRIDLKPHNKKNWELYHESEYSTQFLIKQTWKFGVNIVKIEEWLYKWRYMCDESFKKWYNYRNDFFDSLKADKKKAKAFDKAFGKWENLYSFLPETNRKGEKRESVAQSEVVGDK